MRRRRDRFRLLLCFFVVCCFAAFPLRCGEAPAEPLRFAVIGDSGTGDENQYLIAQRMAEWHKRLPFELVLMLGDNIYGGTLNQGGGNKSDFEEKFDRPYAELLRRGVVFRATLGNHDLQTRDGRDVLESYERFHIERPEGYYSFTAGTWDPAAGAAGLGGNGKAPLVEFFVLNTVRLEKDKRDPEQLAWLERALKASRARWRIIYGHHPLYSSGKRHGADKKLRAKLEPILTAEREPPEAGASGLRREGDRRARVDVVFAGHDHIYERFKGQRGIAYFVCGASGKLRRGNARPDEDVLAVNDQERVFMLWEATAEELRFRAINERGQAFDCGVVRLAGFVRAEACPAAAAP